METQPQRMLELVKHGVSSVDTTISGSGTATVKVLINGEEYGTSQTITYGENYTFE